MGLLAALRDLALKRRAVSFALQRGLPGRPEQLASLMGMLRLVRAWILVL